MYDYDLIKPISLAQCNAMDRAALADGPIGRGLDGFPFFLRREDVTHILAHPNCITGGTALLEQQGIMDGPLHEWFQGFFVLHEPPNHTRLRSLVSKSFSTRSIERLRAVARKEAEAALDSAPPGREFDVFEEFAFRVPGRVICNMLGIEDVSLIKLRNWINDLAPAIVSVQMTPEQRTAAEHALNEMNNLVDVLVKERRAHPGEDLISVLAAAEQEGGMSLLELRAMIPGLLFTGVDTTKTLIGLTTDLMAEHPDQLEKLRENRELVPQAIEEVLRYAPPAPWVARFTSGPIERSGVKLDAGSPVFLSLATANLDQDIERPEIFDVTRKRIAHTSFGHGLHFCLGSALARLEGQETLNALIDRKVDVELTGSTPRWVRGEQLIRPAESIKLRVHA